MLRQNLQSPDEQYNELRRLNDLILAQESENYYRQGEYKPKTAIQEQRKKVSELYSLIDIIGSRIASDTYKLYGEDDAKSQYAGTTFRQETNTLTREFIKELETQLKTGLITPDVYNALIGYATQVIGSTTLEVNPFVRYRVEESEKATPQMLMKSLVSSNLTQLSPNAIGTLLIELGDTKTDVRKIVALLEKKQQEELEQQAGTGGSTYVNDGTETAGGAIVNLADGGIDTVDQVMTNNNGGGEMREEPTEGSALNTMNQVTGDHLYLQMMEDSLNREKGQTINYGIPEPNQLARLLENLQQKRNISLQRKETPETYGKALKSIIEGMVKHLPPSFQPNSLFLDEMHSYETAYRLQQNNEIHAGINEDDDDEVAQNIVSDETKKNDDRLKNLDLGIEENIDNLQPQNAERDDEENEQIVSANNYNMVWNRFISIPFYQKPEIIELVRFFANPSSKKPSTNYVGQAWVLLFDLYKSTFKPDSFDKKITPIQLLNKYGRENLSSIPSYEMFLYKISDFGDIFNIKKNEPKNILALNQINVFSRAETRQLQRNLLLNPSFNFTPSKRGRKPKPYEGAPPAQSGQPQSEEEEQLGNGKKKEIGKKKSNVDYILNLIDQKPPVLPPQPPMTYEVGSGKKHKVSSVRENLRFM